MIETYEGATLMLDGKPIAPAERAENGTAERTIAWTQPLTSTAATADMFREMAFFGGVCAAAPRCTATIHLGGILRVVLPIAVTGADPAREDERGTTVTMHAEADPKAWRRAVSMAVEQAIVTRDGRAMTVCRAVFYGTRSVKEIAGKCVRFCERGSSERKRRKAMRRLLRAAGVTKPQGEVKP